MITGCSSMMVMGNIIITKYRNLDTRSKNNSIQSKCTNRFVMLNQCLFQLNMDIWLCGFSLFGIIYCKKGGKIKSRTRNQEHKMKHHCKIANLLVDLINNLGSRHFFPFFAMLKLILRKKQNSHVAEETKLKVL